MVNKTVSNEIYIKKFPKKNIPILFLSRFISDLGSAVFKFALSLYILDATGSPAIYSLILTLSMMPGILISIIAGTIIDKYDKKKIILWADIISSILVLSMFISLEMIGNNIFILGICVVSVSVVQSFLNLGINSCLANIVEEDELPKANSFFQGMGAIITILGPVISALLYKVIGIKLIMCIDGVSYIIGAILTFSLVFTSNRNYNEHETDKFIDNLKFVFKYVKETTGIKFFMIILAILTFVYSPLTMVAIQYIMRIEIVSSEYQLSFILAALGIGVIAGAISVGIIKNTNSVLRKLPILFLLLGISVIAWVIPVRIEYAIKNQQTILNVPNFIQGILSGWNTWNTTIIFSVIMFFMGVLYTMIIVPTYTYLQLNVPENMRGRIFGIATTALSISGPLGVVIYGQLLQNFNSIIVIVVSAVSILMAILISVFSKDFNSFRKSVNIQ
ncbi:MFS transporter [Clostridium sp. CM028]|uniref:MFS transporter n=1 Tax=unclassified Clostridium TaxID=2614128 RepID=UPI001C6DE4EB|nr:MULTISPECIES: MFS transporter [unclassified Clostridium]MBW9145947.1 MFS transporter [Clostridium sp. CM027]MBW9149634.1 MFS transporter [Clostridium sp. CM028]UVE40922.1 MFS transporter [Clostridium sp. CM027]WLC61589.1 MFS transporter [Clostridium sp. CM028]